MRRALASIRCSPADRPRLASPSRKVADYLNDLDQIP